MMMTPEKSFWRSLPEKSAIVFLWILLISACQGQSIPPSMVDTWVTDNPRYENCYLLITPNFISFVDAAKNVQECSIKKVSTVKKDQVLTATIDIVTPQKVATTIELRYLEDNGGRLSFKNQPHVVWKHLK